MLVTAPCSPRTNTPSKDPFSFKVNVVCTCREQVLPHKDGFPLAALVSARVWFSCVRVLRLIKCQRMDRKPLQVFHKVVFIDYRENHAPPGRHCVCTCTAEDAGGSGAVQVG